MKICCVLFAIVCYVAAFVPSVSSFTVHRSGAAQTKTLQNAMITTLHESNNDSLRDEVESLKREALQRLNELDDKISTKETPITDIDINSREAESTLTNMSTTKNKVSTADGESEAEYMDRKLLERMAVSNDPAFTKIRSNNKFQKDEALLDGSVWKLSLDIGREPGTWMPKDWGVSGNRLKMDLEFEFSDKQLYEREEFLGSMGDAKILSVKDNQMVLSPSLTEGTRTIPVKNGGWRVCKGKGPMGTDLLRFYVETDETVSRKNGDVYCPGGRIYCSCGFFNMRRPSNGEKARYKKKLDNLIIRAEELDDEIAAAGFLDKLKKNAEMIRLKVEMQETAERYQNSSVLEPDASILKFTSSGDVGLTKEGGVCCKVDKGMAIEYHILGRFYIMSKKD